MASAATTPGFEGPEKTIEIDFSPDKGAARGLRTITREQWSELLKPAACSILDAMSNDYVDAFVLSESSLFVYSHKLVIKTCGTTTLLKFAPGLLARAAALDMEVEWFAYTRKDFTYPEHQMFPHRSPVEEIGFLLELFPEGESYMLGPLTGDHWFVFVADYCERPPEESEDTTLNMMMYDIDPAVARQFFRPEVRPPLPAEPLAVRIAQVVPAAAAVAAAAADSGPAAAAAAPTGGVPAPGATAAVAPAAPCPVAAEPQKELAPLTDEESRQMAEEVSANTGIAGLIPRSDIQDWFFDPCGYSMNGLAHSAYWTIHITPEHHCSYASFETNVRYARYGPLVRAVLGVFRPRRFTMTVFADMHGVKRMERLPFEPFISAQRDTLRYRLTSKSHSDFMGDYSSTLGNYELLATATDGQAVGTPPVRRLLKWAVDSGAQTGAAAAVAAAAKESTPSGEGSQEPLGSPGPVLVRRAGSGAVGQRAVGQTMQAAAVGRGRTNSR